MIIAYIADTFGPRQARQCLALAELGHTPHIYTRQFTCPDLKPMFGRQVTFYKGYSDLKLALLTDPCTLAWIRYDLQPRLPYQVAEARPKLPQVIDMNDLLPGDDYRGLAQAKVVTVPCMGFKDIVEIHASGEVVLLENRVPKLFWKAARQRQQCLAAPPAIPMSIGYGGGIGCEDFRDYRRLIEECHAGGWSLFIYPGSILPEIFMEYEDLGAVVGGPRGYFELLTSLSRHTYIWAGSNDLVLPKVVRTCLFDGLLTGRPVITCNLPDQVPLDLAHVEIDGLPSIKNLDTTPTWVEDWGTPVLEDQVAEVFEHIGR